MYSQGQPCPVCGRGNLYTYVGEEVMNFQYKRGCFKEVRIQDVRFYKCRHCREIFYNKEDSKRIEAALKETRKYGSVEDE